MTKDDLTFPFSCSHTALGAQPRSHGEGGSGGDLEAPGVSVCPGVFCKRNTAMRIRRGGGCGTAWGLSLIHI
eukprot:2013349-Prymnesium_polylepis.4